MFADCWSNSSIQTIYNALLKECSFVHDFNEKDEFENEVTEAMQCQTVELKNVSGHYHSQVIINRYR